MNSRGPELKMGDVLESTEISLGHGVRSSTEEEMIYLGLGILKFLVPAIWLCCFWTCGEAERPGGRAWQLGSKERVAGKTHP